MRPNDEKRQALMPIASRYPLREVLAACGNYFEKTGRRITFEYALAAGENDGGKDAEELAGLLKGYNCHVNLIPINPVKERQSGVPAKKWCWIFKINLKNAE